MEDEDQVTGVKEGNPYLQEIDGAVELLHVRQKLIQVVAGARPDALLHLPPRHGHATFQ
jgi:predicted methyltransferase